MSLDRREAIRGLAGSLASAALPKSAASDGQGSTLRRGVNLSHWFAQNFESASDHHYARFVGIRRMEQLARRGFDHVRLPIEPAVLFDDTQPSHFHPKPLRFLHIAVELLHAHGLAVVLDLHPVGTSKDVLLTPGGATSFLQNWRRLAAEFSQTRGPLFLEILNEPTPLTGADWWSLQDQAIRAIREEYPRVPVIANGGNWSNIEDLVGHKPYASERIIYTVHYYAPILFTQQGSETGWDATARVANLGWPLGIDDADVVAHRATGDQGTSFVVRNAVASGSFTSSSMESALEQLRHWQRAYGNPLIYVGEFGVVAKSAPPSARTRWIRAARERFEADNWGWALWDLSPSFGLLQPRLRDPYGTWDDMHMDPEMLTALGMSS